MIRDVKMKQRTNDICFGNTKGLSTFKREVFSYRFKDEPNYQKLRELLSELLANETEARIRGADSSKQNKQNSTLSSNFSDQLLNI